MPKNNGKEQKQQSSSGRSRSDKPIGLIGWLTPGEAAVYAGVSTKTIYNWRKAGMKHVKRNRKSVRMRPVDIDEFLLKDNCDSPESKINKLVDDILKGVTR